MKRINVSGKRPRKLSKTKWLCALGLLSGISLSNVTYSSTASLHTFAEGDVGVYPYSAGSMSYTSVLGHELDLMKSADTYGARSALVLTSPLMKVANDGTVIYKQSDLNTSVWFYEQQSYQENINLLPNDDPTSANTPQGLAHLDGVNISADSQTIGFSEFTYIRTQSEFGLPEYRVDPDHRGHAGFSPDGQTYAGVISKLNQRGISEWVFYTAVRERYGRFSRNAFGGFVYPVHFYESVRPVSTSGDSKLFLTQFRNGYSDPDWVPGAGAWYENGYNFDLTIMDSRGQYKAAIKNVREPVALSRDGRSVLAYAPLESCPGQVAESLCAILWNTKSDVTTSLGSFLPFAMAGDAEYVVGQTMPDNSQWYTGDAVYWDAQSGIQTFALAMQGFGINMTGWTEIFPISVSPDGSKIVGHGLNPDGIRTGFLIDLPHKATEKWQTHDNVGSTVSYFGSWSDDNDGTAFGVSAKQSTEEGANIRFEFEGTRIRVLGTKGLDRGYYGIYIDGVYWGRYSAFECALANSTVLFESDYLGEGKHDILIEVEGSRDYASTGTAIGIDAFEVETYITQPKPSYETGLVPAPVVTKYDHRFITKPVSGGATNHYNQTPPSSSCLACDTQRSSWAYNRASASQGFDSVVDADGDFSVEAWVKYEPTKANIYSTAFDKSSLFEIAADGKRLRVALQDDLVWLGDTQSVASPLNTNDLYDDHVVLTGNWQSGQASLFVNNSLVGSVEVVDDPAATQNVFSIGRPLGFNDDARIDADFAKLSFYKEVLDGTQVEELFTWPTKYGLDFAPYRSPEMSLWLPSCGLGGCEAGVALDYLPIYNGYGLSATGGLPVGGGTGGF